jgi:hypothetical protein
MVLDYGRGLILNRHRHCQLLDQRSNVTVRDEGQRIVAAVVGQRFVTAVVCIHGVHHGVGAN